MLAQSAGENREARKFSALPPYSLASAKPIFRGESFIIN
jgi:hypothetical protein